MNQLDTLLTLFQNKILRIPDYQRGYSWEREHLDALWNDLSNVNFKVENSFHFTGIITLSKLTPNNIIRLKEEGFDINNEEQVIINNEVYYPYNVVDGQQRLTTLLILISILISDIENNDKEKTRFISITQNRNSYHLFGYEKDTPSHQYLIGKIFEDQKMKVTEPETVYTKNLEEAKYWLLLKIKMLNEIQKQNLYNKIINRLVFYVFEIDNNKLDMSLVFETLNYRGKPLSKLELFKNRLIFLITKRYVNEQRTNLINKIVSVWQDIYEWLGKNEGKVLGDDEFLKAFWILYFDHDDDTEKEFNEYDDNIFKHKYPISDIRENELLDIPKIEMFLSKLSDAIKYWFFINNPYFKTNHELLQFDYETKRLLLLINNSGVGQYMKILCLAILFKTKDEENIDIRNCLLKSIEKHNLCTYVLFGKNANTNRAEIMRLINQFFKTRINYSELQQRLIKYTNDNDSFDNINDHIHHNRQRNKKFYDWNGIKYVLWNYKAHLQKKQVNEIEEFSKYHVDLIFPETRGSGVQYPQIARTRSGENVNILRYSLGNITITRRNNSATNFSEFRSLLLNGSYSDREIANYSDWSDQAILNRGLKILEFIEDNWELRIGDEQRKRRLLIEELRVE